MKKMKVIIFQLFLLTIIKTEYWYPPVSGANKEDGKNGYAGSRGSALTHFYLCGSRLYRIHYLGDPWDKWTGEYCCCGVVGNGREIDGIAISGGQGYQVRLKNGDWLPIVYGYNIYNKDEMAGKLNYPIDAVLVNGGDSYRAGIGPSSSLAENVGQKIGKSLFGLNLEFSFEEEKLILNNEKVIVFGKLIYNIENQLKNGVIKFTIQNNNVISADWSGLLPENVKKFLKQIIDVYDCQSSFESKFTYGIVHGDVSVKIYWLEKKIEIYAGAKITEDHWEHRGGIKFTIFMKDSHNDYQKFSKRYAMAININWDKIFSMLKFHQNANHVGNSLISGIISIYVIIAFQALILL